MLFRSGGHVEHVVAERREAAIGEEQGLNDDDDGDHERADPRAEQDRRERATHEVPGGSGGNREIEHLRREDERGGNAGEGNLPIAEFAAAHPKSERNKHQRDDGGGQGDLGFEEPIGGVHRDHVRLVEVACDLAQHRSKGVRLLQTVRNTFIRRLPA